MQPSVLSVAGEERRITPFTIPNPTGLLFVLKQLNFLKKKNGEVAKYHVLNSAEFLKYQAAFFYN